jgi:GNAT superfamily N-acetyltransferase
MQHDAMVEQHWPRLYSDFLNFQFAAFSEEVFVGVGNIVPIHWKSEFSHLPPRGLDWALAKAVGDYKMGLSPNLLVGVQILINPDLRNRGLSYKFIEAMKRLARTYGIEHIALPVRPTLKHEYPLVPMEEYIRWTNDQGDSFDPWIRVHIKAGGTMVSVCPESMTIQGKVNEWQQWTGLSFQSSGLYTIKQALSPVHIDLEEDLGEYIEPNVWFIHTTESAVV